MIVLDENVPENQRQLLRAWGIRVRQIGVDVGRSGLQDEEVIPLLRRLRRPTFFTRDEDFGSGRYCHPRFCLIWLDIRQSEVAVFVRRILHHPLFRRAGDRIGTVLAVSHAGIRCWRSRTRGPDRCLWI